MEEVKVNGKNYPDDILKKIDEADLLIEDGLINEAISIFTNIIDSYPNEAYAYSLRGWLMHKKGDYQSAINDYSNAIKRKSDIHGTIWLRANCYENTGELDNAINDYINYLNYKPNDAEGHYNLGLLYEYKKDYFNAILSYQKSNEIQSSVSLLEKIDELKQKEKK
jgi:tetratricopeptide (TPR) repeat protein